MDNLAKKAFIGIVQLMMGMALMLFLPAWSFDFWQAWVYLLIFGLSGGLTFFYLYKNDPELLKRRLHREEKEHNQKFIQFYIFVSYVGIFIVSSLDHRFGWSQVSFHAELAGYLLVVVGYFIIFMAMKENTFASATIEISLDQRVVSTRAYAIIRHPMYAGGVIMLLGTPLALGSFYSLLMVVPAVYNIAFRILEEERYLFDGLSGYKEYCQRVKYRLVPLIW